MRFQPDAPGLTFFPYVTYYRPDLTISAVQVVQGTALSPSYAVYVAGRSATVRAYVAVSDGSNIPGVTGRLSAYDDTGMLVGSIDSGPITAPSLESDMSRSMNFSLPAAWLKPGYSYHILLDPNNSIRETNKNNNRYPTSGTMAFNFTNVRPLQVMIVPILYQPHDSSRWTLPSRDNNFSYLEWMPAKVMPISSITFQVHSIYTYAPESDDLNLDDASGAGWLNLLARLSALHSQEEPYGSMIYYGLVNSFDAHGCDNGCFTGMAWVVGQGGPATSVGWSGLPNGSFAASKTLTHEMGHNFGREHVACAGSESDPDPYYPYNPHSIGTWGLDVATDTLYDPSQYADYMSYCERTWTSDYTYQGIKSFRDQHLFDATLDRPPVPAYYISGLIKPDGTVTVFPVYRQSAPVPLVSDGPYTVELLGANSTVLASRAFTPARIGDAPGYSGFGIYTPAVVGLAALRIRGNGKVLFENNVPAPRAFGPN